MGLLGPCRPGRRLLSICALLCLLFLQVARGGTVSFQKTADLIISDNSVVSSNITVSGLPSPLPSSTAILIRTNITHTFCRDLIITLKAPGDASRTLSNQRGSSCDDLFDMFTFDTSATTSVSTFGSSCSSYPKIASPEQSLATLTGSNPNGVWSLVISDNANIDTGTFKDWAIDFQNGCLGSNPCQNGGTCNPTSATGYLCTCPPQFSGSECQSDFDECAAGLCHVNATCVNTFGGYNCTCKPGFTGNGASCTDVNECNQSPCHANATCTNNIGSFSCACRHGFSGSGLSCTNVNECLGEGTGNNCHPNATCTDTSGSFLCQCKPGFYGNGVSCTDFNECLGQNGGNNCTANQDCVNTPGSYACECKDGFILEDQICKDIDECAGLNNCSTTHSNCVNFGGGFYCACKDNHTSSSGQCQEVNLCIALQPCQSEADCTNTPEGYSCACKPGFTGDGYVGNETCADINECNTPSICGPHATCANTPGSYQCTCNAGYYRSESTCIDFNECQGENGGNNCSVGASCTNLPGTFSCACLDGFDGNGYFCSEINECLSHPCDTDATCENSIGSYSCTCNPGHFGSGSECFDQPSFVIASLGPFSATFNWTQTPGVSAYKLEVREETGAVLASATLSPSTRQHTLSGFPAYTPLIGVLTTFVNANATSGPQEQRFRTLPAPVSGLEVLSYRSTSVELTWEDSEGAGYYSVEVFEGGQRVLFRILEATVTTRKRTGIFLKAVVDGLSPSSEYQLKMFSEDETVGTSLTFSTLPGAPTSVWAHKLTSTSLNLNWTAVEGATVYRVQYSASFLDPPIQTFTISETSMNITSLPAGSFVFKVFSGTSLGIDTELFAAVTASPSAVSCLATTSGNANWPITESGSSTFGTCVKGYAGKPSRSCMDEGGTEGVFGPISSPCVKLPDPLSTPPTVTIHPFNATISWVLDDDCLEVILKNVISNTEYDFTAGEWLSNTSFVIYAQPYTPFTVKLYCGNNAGFEDTGRSVTFRTHLERPRDLQMIGSNETLVWLIWAPVNQAEWYKLVSIDPTGQAITLLPRVQGTFANLTDLTKGTTYNFTVFAGKGDDGYTEPYGSNAVVYVVPAAEKRSAPVPMIVGAVVGAVGGCLLILLAVFLVLLVRKQRKLKNAKSTLLQKDNDRATISMSDLSPQHVQLSRRQSQRTADATLLNTTMEISVPGFLLLDYFKQIRVEGALGAGGGGTVFKGVILDQDVVAQHNVTEVALKKVTLYQNMSQQENLDRFLQEISISWSCNFHPNIMKIVGYCLEPEYYMVTKLYEIDLFTLIHHPQEEISPLLALKISADVASAMSFMQEMGIIHRDLKSANVLLETVDLAGGEKILRAVICDFGLAKVTNSALVLTSQKFENFVGFSPRYTAPEVFTHVRTGFIPDPEIEKKGDVYSFAIVVWELLTRGVPWVNISTDGIQRNVLSGARPEVPTNPQENPARQVLIELMQSAWQQAPEARPTFKAIHQKLSSLL